MRMSQITVPSNSTSCGKPRLQTRRREAFRDNRSDETADGKVQDGETGPGECEVSQAIADFAAPLKADAIPERSINSLGYRLLSRKKIADAIRIFELNVELHPDSANTYDSLGEAHMAAGDKAQAVKNYEKSLAGYSSVASGPAGNRHSPSSHTKPWSVGAAPGFCWYWRVISKVRNST